MTFNYCLYIYIYKIKLFIFLEAFVPVENYTEWNFGPEYKFKFNKDTIVFTNIIVSENITATVKYRSNKLSQNDKNYLLCIQNQYLKGDATDVCRYEGR